MFVLALSAGFLVAFITYLVLGNKVKTLPGGSIGSAFGASLLNGEINILTIVCCLLLGFLGWLLFILILRGLGK